ncbi:MAG: alpha-L-rhamnosidase C-terminal domain-containing protein [Eubacteriales bacterium]|nr:alpha-L-rhamnosidase C-terminal domain-containing protein [Eubacteriales bacterium]
MEYLKDSNWVWSPSWNAEDKEGPRIVLFRKTIKLEAEPIQGTIQISADTKYKLYINDKFVEIGPSRGDKQIWFYDSISVLPWLKEGVNTIAVKVLRYPEEPDKGNHGMFRTSVPGLYVSGSIQDAQGKKYDLSADASWKCKKEEGITFVREEERFAPLMIHEKAQGNAETFGWKRESYDDRRWESARPYMKMQIHGAVSPGNLCPRTIPFMYRKKRLFEGVMDIKESVHTDREWNDFLQGRSSITIPAKSEEIIEIDAGEEMTGYPRTSFLGGHGSMVHFLYSEAYVQEGVIGPEKIPVKTDRTDKIHGHLQGYEDIYRVHGLGDNALPEVYEPYWFRTFRFVRLHIITGEEPLTLCAMNYEETGYPLQVETMVETSDESLKKIWEISERTLRRCMHESYEDCPFYEQLQYIMDARTQILYTYSVSADDRLARKCMDDLRRSQRYDGLLNCSYPNCNPNIIPGFSIYYILMVYDHMMYFGDKKLVQEHMPAIEQILNFFEAHLTPEHYVGKIGGVNMEAPFWSFIDWADHWQDTSGMPTAGRTGALTMESLLYIYGLQYASRLALFLNRKEDSDMLLERAKRVQAAVRACCTGRNGMLQDGPGIEEYSQHCQVFAILTDTADIETGRQNLLKTIRHKEYTQCTVAMRFYLFRALEKTGLYQYTNQYWEAWRKMIANHCTTCVESEAYARSECHAWGALALYELPGTVLGVRPAEPGYRKIQIAPVSGYLTSAAGRVKTPVGDVWVSWKIEDGKCRVDYKAPQGIEVVG